MIKTKLVKRASNESIGYYYLPDIPEKASVINIKQESTKWRVLSKEYLIDTDSEVIVILYVRDEDMQI